MRFIQVRDRWKDKLYQLATACLGCGLLLSAKCEPSGTPKTEPVTKAIGTDPGGLPYLLDNPSLTINLVSEDLREISGLSPTDSAGIFCAIADERGEIYFIDGNGGGAITRRVLFREKGDFEGVEMVGKNLYATKSNGTVYEVTNWEDPAKMKVTEYELPLTKKDDVEGLGYDAGQNRLLLACKGDPDADTPRKVYAFDLKTKTMAEKPAYVVHPSEVNKLVAYGPEERHQFFSPSAIAIHPLNKDVYLISTALKRLVVLNPVTGAVRYAVRLDKKILPQPEGLAFDEQGNLYLSSEGKEGEGLVLKFDYKSGQ